jgi:hypothetical protein
MPQMREAAKSWQRDPKITALILRGRWEAGLNKRRHTHAGVLGHRPAPSSRTRMQLSPRTYRRELQYDQPFRRLAGPSSDVEQQVGGVEG